MAIDILKSFQRVYERKYRLDFSQKCNLMFYLRADHWSILINGHYGQQKPEASSSLVIFIAVPNTINKWALHVILSAIKAQMQQADRGDIPVKVTLGIDRLAHWPLRHLKGILHKSFLN